MDSLFAVLWEEALGDFPDVEQLFRVLIRIALALALGAVPGIERQRMQKAAGVRTHMLVALGAALLALLPQVEGMPADAKARIIQGTITGIGFIGGGAILKISEAEEVKGITTAASIWITAALGIAVGLGHIGVAVISAVLTLVVLRCLRCSSSSD